MFDNPLLNQRDNLFKDDFIMKLKIYIILFFSFKN